VSERGTRWLLVALLVVQLGLLTGQASRVDAPRPYVERLLLRGLGPLAQGVVAVQHGFGQLGSRLESRRALWQENRELKGRVETLERQLIRLQGLKSDYDRLAAALEYAERQGEQLAVADIVYSDHASWLKTLVVQVGGSSARVNQPVVAEQGLVGRVVQVDGGYAKIQPITDRASAVGAMIERTRRQGVVRGAGAAVVELDYVPLQAEVRVGDRRWAPCSRWPRGESSSTTSRSLPTSTSGSSTMSTCWRLAGCRRS
jgi:rod shape-determining protein MreC